MEILFYKTSRSMYSTLILRPFSLFFLFYFISILFNHHASLNTCYLRAKINEIISHHMPVRLKTSPKVQRTRLQHAKWLGNTTALIFVVDNDIYLRQSPSDEEDIRLTFTGQPELIYNGIPDWLYQGK